MQRFDDNISFQKEEMISWKHVDDNKKAIILNIGDGSFFSLDDQTSMFIWEMIVDGENIEAMRNNLANRYQNVEQEKLNNDLDCFLDLLVERKIICVRP